MNIIEVQTKDLRHFTNLVNLDISENEVALEDLVNMSSLEILNMSMNKIS